MIGVKGKRVIIVKMIFFKHLDIAHSKETDFKLCCILVPLFPQLKVDSVLYFFSGLLFSCNLIRIGFGSLMANPCREKSGFILESCVKILQQAR